MHPGAKSFFSYKQRMASVAPLPRLCLIASRAVKREGRRMLAEGRVRSKNKK